MCWLHASSTVPAVVADACWLRAACTVLVIVSQLLCLLRLPCFDFPLDWL